MALPGGARSAFVLSGPLCREVVPAQMRTRHPDGVGSSAWPETVGRLVVYRGLRLGTDWVIASPPGRGPGFRGRWSGRDRDYTGVGWKNLKPCRVANESGVGLACGGERIDEGSDGPAGRRPYNHRNCDLGWRRRQVRALTSSKGRIAVMACPGRCPES